MKDEYFLINKKALPEYFELVLKAKEDIEINNGKISDACIKYNISRSTYYKYKDYIFRPMNNVSNKVQLGIHTEDEKGVLSNILTQIAYYNGNVLTLNQDMPIHDDAYITITIDTIDLNCEIDELIKQIKKINKIKAVDLIAFEG